MPGLGGFNPCPIALGGDAISGLTAEQWSRFTADLSAVALTAPIALVHYRISGVAPLLLGYLSADGAGVPPTLTRTGAGLVAVVWPVFISDGFDVPEPFNIRHAKAFSNYDLAARTAWANVVGPNVVYVQTRTANTGAAVDSEATLVVW